MSRTLDQIQWVQSTLIKLQSHYRHNTPEFWALGLAEACTHLAWYMVRGEANKASEKLASVQQAIADYECTDKTETLTSVNTIGVTVYCSQCFYTKKPDRLGIAIWDPQRQGHYCDRCGTFINISQISAPQ